jgi:parvulin-like peptidyl-prolyl isomerase
MTGRGAAQSEPAMQSPAVAPAVKNAGDTASFLGTVLQVNGDAITSREILNALKLEMGGDSFSGWADELGDRAFRDKLLDTIFRLTRKMVYNKLIYLEAKKELEKNDEHEEILKSAMADQKKKVLTGYDGNEALAREKLAAENITLEEILKDFEEQMVIGSYRQNQFNPTQAVTRWRMLQYYRRYLEEKYTEKPQIQFQLVDIPAKDDPETARQLAETACREYKEGRDFKDVVKEYSQGFRKDRDGHWGPYDPSALKDTYLPIVNELTKLEKDQCTGVVEGENRYFVAKLVEYKKGRIVPFPEVQDSIQATLEQQRWDRFRTKLNKTLFKDATVGDMELFTLRIAQDIYDRFGKSKQANRN